jgi:transglutaminase-like putative cysteine protease
MKSHFGALAILAAGVAAAAEPNTRTFELTYEARWTGLPPSKVARVWFPVPPANTDQDVTVIREELPGTPITNADSPYRNKIRYFEAPVKADGTFALRVDYKVTRRERRTPLVPTSEDPARVERLLKADQLVPIGGKSMQLLRGREVPKEPMAAARVFYDAVLAHMKYSKEGTGWGRGDVDWACDSRFGNCSDFHSLFISMARAHKMPAVFAIGFPLPERRGAGAIGGYHCWALVRVAGTGWVPVDISEASKHPAKRDYYFGGLSADRVVLSVGRDIELVPKAASAPLNFFVHPHLEIEGKSVDADRVQFRYAYRDLE